MKIFISYKFTGVSLDELHSQLDPVIDCLEKQGHSVFCNITHLKHYSDNKMSDRQIMEHALENLNKSECYVVIHNGIAGEGMGIEFGVAYNKQLPRILFLKTGKFAGSMKALATDVIEFADNDDLVKKISTVVK